METRPRPRETSPSGTDYNQGGGGSLPPSFQGGTSIQGIIRTLYRDTLDSVPLLVPLSSTVGHRRGTSSLQETPLNEG